VPDAPGNRMSSKTSPSRSRPFTASRPCQASWRLREAAGHIARWHGSEARRDGRSPRPAGR